MTVDLKKVRQLWDDIDENGTGVGYNDERWDIAESLWRAWKDDKLTQVEIAAAVGRHQTTVGKWMAVWEREAEFGDMPFSDALQISKLITNDMMDFFIFEKVLRTGSAERVRKLIAELPRERRDIILGAKPIRTRPVRTHRVRRAVA